MRIQLLIVLLCYLSRGSLVSADSHDYYDDSGDLGDATSFTGSEYQELELAAVEMNHPYSRVNRPDYSFEFDVDADQGGKSHGKSHQKTRDGRKVQGQYRVLQPDGTVKVVEYRTDPITGNIKATVEYGRI